MIISVEQTRLAARYVEPPAGSTRTERAEVPPELMSRIVSAIDAAPEMRADRVVEAMDRQETAAPGSREIAEMIIKRTICDSLR